MFIARDQRGDSSAPFGQSESTPRPLLALFCVYVLAWFWQVGVRREWLGAIRFEFYLGALLALIAVVVLTIQPRSRISGQWPTGLIGSAVILFMLIAIQVPLSIVPLHSGTVFIERVFKFAFMGIFVIAFVKSTSDLKWLVATLFVAWGYLTFESFRAGLSGSMIWESQGIPRLRGDTPMFRHPNSLAGMASGVLPFAFFVFPLLKRNWIKVLLLASVVTALGCVMYSGSRTAYVGVAALVMYLAFAVKRSMLKAIVIAIIVTVAAVAVLPDAYKARVGTLVTGQDIEGGSLDARMNIQRQALAVFKAHPFGVGVGAFPEMRERMFGRRPDTHNLYLEVATNLGIQGLLAFLIFVFLLVRTLWNVVLSSEQAIQRVGAELVERRSADRDCGFLVEAINDYRWLRGVALAVTGYVFVRLILGLFGMDLYELYWWLSLGFAVALWRLRILLDSATGMFLAKKGDENGSSTTDVPGQEAGGAQVPHRHRLGLGR